MSGDESGTDGSVTRRTVLTGAVGATALALGAGGVTANGKGGQSFVLVEDFDEDGTFEIVDGPFEAPSDREIFRCGSEGRGLSFPYWEFEYEGEDETRRLFTRDNSIDTSVTYRWNPKDKTCSEESGEYKQVGFVVD